MASLLDSFIKNTVAQKFKGRLSVGSLRRETNLTLDSAGDPVAGPPTFHPFEGIRDTFSAFFAAQAGIPLTDSKILIIAGSINTIPTQDDKVLIRGQWFQLRRLTARDPANATFEFAAFEIAPPA